jgi:16S rRNA (cytosine967-C5)-methyltransferase
MNLRARASLVIVAVFNGQSLSEALPIQSRELTDPRDRGLLQEICFGVLRHRWRLQTLRDRLLSKPLEDSNGALAALLLVGLYQLLYLRVGAHAAVNETVNAAVDIKEGKTKGLVNAILRRAQRESAKHLDKIDRDLALRFSHPKWMVDAWRSASLDLEPLMAANNEAAPMTLRVNRQKFSRDQYLEKLQAAQIVAQAHPLAVDGIVLAQACDVSALPGFADGEVSVQDAAAQLAADLIDLKPQLSVLDACCAPGGKTAHILEREPSVKLTALDNDGQRMQRVKDNLQRLGLQAECLVDDVFSAESEWLQRRFDRILCDAPCSATGVIRRHPDIKSLRRVEDIAKLADTQARMLKKLWTLLKPDGILLYATCSTMRAENDNVISRFVAAHSDAELQPLPNGKTTWQIRPGEQQMDGFFYARLHKKI